MVPLTDSCSVSEKQVSNEPGQLQPGAVEKLVCM